MLRHNGVLYALPVVALAKTGRFKQVRGLGYRIVRDTTIIIGIQINLVNRCVGLRSNEHKRMCTC